MYFPTPLSKATSPKLSEPKLLSSWYSQYSPKISKFSSSKVWKAELVNSSCSFVFGLYFVEIAPKYVSYLSSSFPSKKMVNLSA